MVRWKRPTDIDKVVAENIRRYRLERNWSQGQLGEAIEVSFQQIQKYENGKDRITIGRLVLLCEVLEVDLQDMVRIVKTRKPG